MSQAHKNSEFELQWFRRHLLEEILPAWQGAITDSGYFACHFDSAWGRENKGFGTLVSQSRLIYNFAQGYALTSEQSMLDAVDAGARFLVENFWDADFGGWIKSCSPDGAIVDDQKDSYGHAFVLFGMSHAYLATGEPRYLKALEDTWAVFTDHFKDEHGGYKYFMSRDFQHADELRSQNPLMHLFEALLAAGDIPGMGEMHREAVRLADFILNLVHANEGVLPEVYSADWLPLPFAQEGRIDVGHAFEWAFLMSSAAERGLSDAYEGEGRKFLNYGLRLGYDMEHGGIFSPVAPDGSRNSQRKGWWEQCETIRALLRYVDLHAREDLWSHLKQTLTFVQDQFLDKEHGGWYMSLEPGLSPATQPKGNEVKLDYHVVGMCMEAIRMEDAK